MSKSWVAQNFTLQVTGSERLGLSLWASGKGGKGDWVLVNSWLLSVLSVHIKYTFKVS